MSLPTDAKTRKAIPIWSGVLRYFPDAIAAVAELSRIGNDQHNHGQPLHWAREKSTDQEDCAARHLLDVGTVDTDGVRHSAKLAWRALAILQLEIEKERATAAVILPYGRDLEALTAQRAAHNADPTTRHGGQPMMLPVIDENTETPF
jgi:hypothetical protein